MRFSLVLLAPLVAALATPEQANHVARHNEDVAQLREILQRMKIRSAQGAAPPAPAPTGGAGTGIEGALGDLSTLFGGLSDTLGAACNLRQEVISIGSSLGI